MNVASLFGYSAAILGSIAAFPQVYKTWKTKSAKDLSYGTLLFLGVELLLWLIYGITLNSIPMVISNVFGVSAITAVIILKFKYRN